MQTPRSIRLMQWYIKGIVMKYKTASITGVFVGLCIGFFGQHVFFSIISRWSVTTYRIGLVGIYTIEKLPDAVLSKISIGLTTIGSDGTAKPGLAYAWEATDSGKQYIFYLKRDYLWEDKTPVTARDINYQIKDVSFSLINDYTIKAILPSPYIPFPFLVSRPIFKSGIMGFGQYKIDSMKQNGNTLSYIRLVPVFENLPIYEYRFYQTEKEAIIGFKMGDIDELEDISTPDELSNWKTVSVDANPDRKRIITVFFNMKKTELQNRSLRQAFGYTLPTVSQVIRVYSPIETYSWAYNDKIKKYDFDSTHAQKLFKDSKVAGDFRITISTFPQYVKYAEELQKSWSSVFSIPINISVVQSVPSDYQILLASQTIPPDPDQYILWHSTRTDTNITGYSSVKIDKLLEDGRKETDMTTRKQIYADFQKYIVEDAPALFWFHPFSYSVKRK